MTRFEPSRLVGMVDGPDAEEFAHELVRTYQRLLGQRVSRLVDAVLSSDVDVALDAVLSLKVSSTMVGAIDLAELASFIETDVRGGDLPSARSQALLLQPVAERTSLAIDDYFEHAGNDLTRRVAG